MLDSYEGVISADTGHVAVHEGGAIEFSGHKVLTIPSQEGKITAQDVENYIETFESDFKRTHGVSRDGLYFTSNRIWNFIHEEELQSLSRVCRRHQIPLFMDGARLGYGLMSNQTNVTIEDVAKYCDVFYIGGTKIGALCGEAIVFTKQNEPKTSLQL